MRPISILIFLLLFFMTDAQTNKKLRFIEERTITNLYDAFGKENGLIKDFGFSCITKYNGKVILFDSGSNADIFRENILKMKIDLKKIDIVVLSHGHFDHINGMDFLLKVNPKVKIYFPYDIFWGAPVPNKVAGHEPNVKSELPREQQYFNGEKTEFFINQSGRFWNANIEFVKDSKEILPGLNLIFTASEYIGYFNCYPEKGAESTEPKHDHCGMSGLPEISLSMKTENGETLIVGCSHTGVENIIEVTKNYTKNNINLVMGGFHMIPFDRKQTDFLANKIQNTLGVKKVAPAHCTGHLAFKILKDKFAENYIFAGLGEEISF